jgi:RecA/RadA recombinase
MTTLAHRIVANAPGWRGVAAYIDLTGTLDPDYAARCGVTLERLLIVRPRDAGHA